MRGRWFQDAVTALGVVALLGVCVVPVLFILSSDKPVDTATVVAGVVAPAAISLPALVWLVSRWWGRRQAPAVSTVAQLAQAADQLAQAVLTAWRQEAADRRITTPAPVRVQWYWSSEQAWSGHQSALEPVPGAGPAPIPGGHPAADEVLVAGVVTRLHDELYTRLPHGRLVLTGVGGAGKTGAMILLLLAALEHRIAVAPDQRDQVPVPVWLTLGGWNPQVQSLPEWASATMYRDHPYLRAPEFGPDAAAGLLGSGRVALFLDGLDEIAPGLRDRALRQVEAAAAGLRIVLTSRPEEYQQASASGRWHNVAEVELRPVEPATARAYLLADQHGAQRERWDQVGAFLQAHPGSVAARVLNTPLTLSLARDAYRHTDPHVLTDFTDEQALRRHLIERSLTVAYPDDRDRAHATYWLGWIAHHMGPDRDLEWWQLPTWVNQRRLRLTTALLMGTGTALVPELTFGLSVWLVAGPLFGLFGLLVGLLVGPVHHQPRSFRLRWPRPRELVLAPVSGLPLGLIGGLTFGPAVGLVVGLVMGLLVVLAGFAESSLPQHAAATPTSAFHADRRAALVSGLVAGLVGGPAVGLGGGPWSGPWSGLVSGLWFGLVGGLVGRASSNVLISQIVLKSRSTGYVRFLPLLENASRRQVLRQAGTVYQFRHAALQDHLAEVYRQQHRP